MRSDANGLEILPREECLRLVGTVPIGRVVTTRRALPVALPVNFAVVDDAVVFRSAAGTKLYSATRTAVVGFEVDDFDSTRRTGWSVLIVGGSRVVDDPGLIERFESLVPRAWAPGPFPAFVRIEVVQITGRRIMAAGQRPTDMAASVGQGAGA
jgi:nitroimidazol reductase NimA-like FMN-containing flavoprotein (pyridoxamine 5'-phosphate oxidase superfamily)